MTDDRPLRELTFRAGLPSETSMLNEMTLAGVRYYDHPHAPDDDFAGLATMLEAGHPKEVVTVAEDDSGVVGFYGLVDEGDHVELLRMFLRTDLIGRGYGIQLWAHAVDAARAIGDRMRILADPGARGFYERRGAVLEKEWEPNPGFTMGIYWYDLTKDRTDTTL